MSHKIEFDDLKDGIKNGTIDLPDQIITKEPKRTTDVTVVINGKTCTINKEDWNALMRFKERIESQNEGL